MATLHHHLIELLKRPSVSPSDAGCQTYIATFLEKLGFTCTFLPFGEVTNLWARIGNTEPLLVFAGHTDVVPPGDLNKWDYPPFEPTIKNGRIYARGTADMKGAIAAMLVAVENALNQHKLKGSIAFLLTSDEEAEAKDGTVKVVQWLKENKMQIDHTLIGEPSCQNQLGDMAKVGRRGSLSGELKIKGIQGHIAYPHLADNPIHRALPALTDLLQFPYEKQKADYFDATSFQFSNLNAGLGVGNVIPPELIAHFNFRYSPAVTAEELTGFIHQILQKHQVKYELIMNHSGKPFYSKPGKLFTSLSWIIKNNYQIELQASTTGGTSDGRFLIDCSKDLLEFGLVNSTIHKMNENVELSDLEKLVHIYQGLVEELCCST